jgi:hypothetical protein
MLVALAIFLALHGFAHLVGFATPWGLIKDAAPQTAILGGKIPLDHTAMRGLGMLWLITALLFMISAVALLRHETWWEPFTIAVAVLSLLLSIAFSPQASIGVAINVLLIAFIAVNRSAGWVAVPA